MTRLLCLTKLAWRNLFRNKRRTALTLLILTLGNSALILVGGFLDDLMVHMREDFIHTQNGHIQISRPGFIEEGVSSPLDYLIDDFSQLSTLLAGEDHVVHVVPRLKLLGVASAGRSSVAVQLIGVDPAAESFLGQYRHTKNSTRSVQIVKGRPLDPRDVNASVIGHGLLKNLSLQIDDPVNFLMVRQEGALDGNYYAIAGSFQTFMKAFDERTMFVPLEAAQGLVGRSDVVNSILLLLDRTELTDRVSSRIRDLLKENRLPFEAIPWHEQADYYHQCRLFLDKIFTAVMTLMMAIFAFTVSNVMTLALRERTREFGTMMALGNYRTTIFLTILIESIFLGLLSAVLGLLWGYSFGQLISWIGIPMPPPPQGTAGYEAVIALSSPLFVKTAVLTVLSPLVGAIIPAFRCSRTTIVGALSYV